VVRRVFFSPDQEDSEMKTRNVTGSILAVAALTMLAAMAPAQTIVTFNPVTGGPWGGPPYPNLPGDYIFTEPPTAIDVYVQEFQLGTYTGFVIAELQPAFAGFGSGQVLWVSNINMEFDFSPYGPNNVWFFFADLGGQENLQVNGAALLQGEIMSFAGPVAPGVTLSFSGVTTIPGGYTAMAILTGPVTNLWVGGQEFYLEDVTTAGPVPTNASSLSDVKALFR
jgi:hypothetical protein